MNNVPVYFRTLSFNIVEHVRKIIIRKINQSFIILAGKVPTKSHKWIAESAVQKVS